MDRNDLTPERREGESMDEYRARRRRGNRFVRNALAAPTGGTSLRKRLRDAQRANGNFRAGAYGQGLRNAITRKQRDALAASRAKRVA